jgi:hypothetical protein
MFGMNKAKKNTHNYKYMQFPKFIYITMKNYSL